MRVPSRERPTWRTGPLALSLALSLVVVTLVALPSASASYPPLPISIGGKFIQDLNAPTLTPGSNGGISFVVENALDGPAFMGVLNLSLYAFNAYPGNASGPLPTIDQSPTFGSGLNSVSLPLSSPLAAGATVMETVPIDVPGGAPQGDFALRISLSFTENGTGYLLESRGFFSNALWANATTAPGGGATLNLSVLGVSGVLPESAIQVRTNAFTVPLYTIFAIAVVLAGLGGYYAFRKAPGSKSGTRSSPEESRAPKALGKSRSSDGD